MRLITPYAPGSFLKPCIVVSTVAVSGCCETIVFFVEALNVDAALRLAFAGEGCHVRIQAHASCEAAVGFHLALVAPFKNGGSEEEWEEGWEPYLALYDKWCPAEFKEEAGA